MCANGEPNSCKYEVRCIVDLGGGASAISLWKEWEVFVFQTTPGVEPPYFKELPSGNGVIEVPSVSATGSGNNWTAKVVGKGNCARVSAKLVPNGMEACNGFYYKIVQVHERKHLDQWASETPWEDLYDTDAFYEANKDLTKTGTSKFGEEHALRTELRNRINDKKSEDDATKEATKGDREIAAHGLSNQVDPQYKKLDKFLDSQWR